jgi:oxygen-independent coproporphyrinogen-3 oxidase
MIIAAPSVSEQEELASYAYSYPHKSSYGLLTPAVPIGEAWRYDDVRHLSLYVHVPFCEMRCGFCNLFTESQPAADVADAYLATLCRQMQIVAAQVPAAEFSQFALGGGTPTYLSARQLESLLTNVAQFARRSLRELPASVEMSPATATIDRLRVLADHGVRRISIGVQSFSAVEARRFGRPQQTDDALHSLDRIRRFNFPLLNIDLIYGEASQTVASWQNSLQTALLYRPEELYLYPLYVRPETGLAGVGVQPAQHRADLYAAACELLGAAGYRQASLRCFRREHPSSAAGEANSATYACQRDGMIGLGCGARSYTERLHYGTRFAVTQAGVRAILRDWIAQTNDELALATHGVWLSDDERRRRFVILSLLQSNGLDLAEFRKRYPTADVTTMDGMRELMDCRWIESSADKLTLTRAGMQHSDVIGPRLYSESVRRRLREFVQSSKPESARARR